jgi:hypothetical protein
MRPQQQQQQALHGGGGSMYIGGPAGVVQHQHHLPQHRMTGTYVTSSGRNNQRPPNVSIGPDGINIGGRGSAEWRHLLMSQQQNAVFGTQMRPAFNQGKPLSLRILTYSMLSGTLPVLTYFYVCCPYHYLWDYLYIQIQFHGY